MTTSSPGGDRHEHDPEARRGISSKKVGLAPGSVVFTGTQRVERPIISTITYTSEQVAEESDVEVGTLRTPTGAHDGVHWVNVAGLHDTDLIVELGDRYRLHRLLMEDVTSVRARPSFIDYEEQAFLSLKMLSWSAAERVEVEHVSLVLGDDYVISFQERPGDVFDGVRSRIRGGTTRIRKRDAEYLWYALIDAVVDHYVVVIDALTDRVEELEARVWLPDGDANVPSDVQALRAETTVVRRALRPLREEIEAITKEPPEWFSQDIQPFIADLRSHVFQSSDALEALRDQLTSVMDAHLSVVATRTNDVMRVLTIMASIFIPLTFVAGVYGMNFQHMPELDEPYGYAAVWVVMVTLGLGMVAYFRRKGWL